MTVKFNVSVNLPGPAYIPFQHRDFFLKRKVSFAKVCAECLCTLQIQCITISMINNDLSMNEFLFLCNYLIFLYSQFIPGSSANAAQTELLTVSPQLILLSLLLPPCIYVTLATLLFVGQREERCLPNLSPLLEDGLPDGTSSTVTLATTSGVNCPPGEPTCFCWFPQRMFMAAVVHKLLRQTSKVSLNGVCVALTLTGSNGGGS